MTKELKRRIERLEAARDTEAEGVPHAICWHMIRGETEADALVRFRANHPDADTGMIESVLRADEPGPEWVYL